ncbi:PREDICTED: BAG family molecular chaperone regulator 8, chloroplastic-like [Camelina sativa]|uniref:BAG family molecular chaperone regulator 8, chloroplastic-like n=1 Tax=Camelina sativa TaxID=90675 RepID=A0ABM0YLT7_CAMSA|nr:PREDICTED: BAG family molecular chaperone regulator 8, chloroplastic-like [Camelina sativa]
MNLYDIEGVTHKHYVSQSSSSKKVSLIHGTDLVKSHLILLDLVVDSAADSMASHHHHGCVRHQNHHNKIPLFATSSHCCTQINHPSPPPPPPEDNLIHLVATYLQNQQQQETQCSCEASCQNINVVSGQHRVLRQQKSVPREYDQDVLSCLLRKIDDLESSLSKFSSCYDRRRRDRHSTLRDSAARVIQTHFRSYLVHRSISFRQLKELATIKSTFLSLKSSVSGKPIFPFKAVSQKATDLLLQLDSIQGRIDPMIRSSKRSLSRDLVRFLQYVDDCAVKRSDFVAKSSITVSSRSKLNGKKPQGFGVADDRTIEKSRKVFVTSSEDEDSNADMTVDSEEVPVSSIDKRKIGSSNSRTGAVIKGNVVKPSGRTFVLLDKNRNVYHQVYGNTHNLTSSAEDDSVDGHEEPLVMSRDSRRRHSLKTRNGVSVNGSGAKTSRVVKAVSVDGNGNVCKVYGDTDDLTSSAEDDDSVDDGEETLVMSRDDGKRHSLKTGNRVLVKGSGGKTIPVVKTVSFDENGNVYKAYGDTPESSVSEEGDSTSGSNGGNGEGKGNVNEVEEIKYVPKENESFKDDDEEEETDSENEVSSSEGSEGVTRNMNHQGNDKHEREIQVQKGSLMFSPPLPLQMEP